MSRSSENYIKGRIAETIIEELYTSLGYKVYRFGLENTIPALITNWNRKYDSYTGRQISNMPDFVIQRENYSPDFIEVKFRSDGCFSIKDVPDEFCYINTKFIIVSKTDIQSLWYSELVDGKSISPETSYQLFTIHNDRKEFQMFKEFKKYLEKYLSKA